MANTVLTVTGLSFDDFRSDLRNFLAAKPIFKDIDFADAAVGTLLDLLAYNDYRLAFYANMAANEGFLDTAQLYDSVVSRAKALGYVPISAKGAEAQVQVTFGLAANSTVRSLTVNKHTKFTATVNGAGYVFVTPTSTTIPANANNQFVGVVTVTEGLPLTYQFVYSAANTFLTIPNANTDLRSVEVTVTAGSNTTSYFQADDIFAVTATSPVFFVTPASKNLYTIGFGDGILGLQPPSGSVVQVAYRVCSAAKTNGANTFTASGAIAGQDAFTLTTVQRATGGSEQEPIGSVRFNAPLAYETQNRAVTSSDYIRLILRDNPDLSGVNVWGGEQNTPPIYGKVFIAVKPNNAMAISQFRKDEILTAIQRYNVQTVDPVFVDATYLYLSPEVVCQYAPRLYTGTATDLANKVAVKVANYEADVLNRFGGKFLASKFLAAVDSASAAVVGSTLFLRIAKRFVPDTVKPASYTFMFNNPLNHPTPGYLYALSSTGFTFKGQLSYLDDDGFGAVRIYYLSTTGARVYVSTTAGTVDYATGQVQLANFAPTAYVGTEITITVEPAAVSYNIQPVRNQILLLRDAVVSIVNDTTGLREVQKWAITTLGTSATVLAPSYTTSVAF